MRESKIVQDPDNIRLQERTEDFLIEDIERDGAFNMSTRHFHGSYEVYYLLEGSRYYFIDRSIYEVHAGDVIFIAQNRIHKTTSMDGNYHRRLLFQISEERMDEWLAGPSGSKYHALFYGEEPLLHLPASGRKQLVTMFDSICLEAVEKKPGYDDIIACQIQEFLLRCWRHREAEPSNERYEISKAIPASDKIRMISEAAEYLALHFAENESLDSLAERFFINKYYLTRQFRSVTGVTITEYIQIRRIHRAEELLSTTSLPITEIGAAVGYENTSYFEKIFSRYHNCTPGSYRKSHQNSPSSSRGKGRA